MRRTTLRCVLGLVTSGLLLSFVASTSADAAANRSDEVWLPFNASSGVAVTVKNAGTSDTVQKVVTSNGGSLRFVASYATAGNAMRFPAYDGAASGPRAILAVTNAGAGDMLNPVGRAFRFGADVRRDVTSSGTYYDNGNNVIQRGLFDAASQYKIQLDYGRASCRVNGPRGAVVLTSSRAIADGSWYRLTCRRINLAGPDRFTLSVRSIHRNGSLGAATTVRATALVGKLSYASTTPLSVGGKLDDDLAIVGASDQFNGKIDNPFFRLG